MTRPHEKFTRIPEAFHFQRHPFPMTRPDGSLLANDELCHCHHMRSAHVDTVAYGHGACMRCNCAKFTWMKFLIPPLVMDPPEQWPGAGEEPPR